MKTMEQRGSFVNGINFSELFRHIEVSTGMVLAFSEIEIENIRGEAIISCFSQDTRENCGVFGKILARCVGKFQAEFMTDMKATKNLASDCGRIWNTNVLMAEKTA